MASDVLFILGLLGFFTLRRARSFDRGMRLRRSLIHDTPSKVRHGPRKVLRGVLRKKAR